MMAMPTRRIKPTNYQEVAEQRGFQHLDHLRNKLGYDVKFYAAGDPSWAKINTLYRAAMPSIRHYIQTWYADGLKDLANPINPHRGLPNFNSMASIVRPFMLGAFLDVKVGDTYPTLDLARSAPERGHLVYLVNGPLEVTDWQKQLPRIAGWLGGPWVIGAHDATSITLLQRQPLPATFRFRNAMLNSGHLFAGINTNNHKPVQIPFADLPSGTLLVGAAGSGKSNGLHVLIRSVFANLQAFSAVYLVDGKLGEAFARYRDVHPKVHVLWERQDLWALTAKLAAEREARNRAQTARGIDNARSGYVALIIDEMAVYTQKPSVDGKNPLNKQHSQFLDHLGDLALFGRSSGFRMIISAQQPVADHVPMNVKGNCNTAISFRLPTDQHVTGLFGQIEGLPADPRKLTRGHALIHHGLTGTYDVVQFPLITPPRRHP